MNFPRWLGPVIAVMALTATLVGDSRLKTSMIKIDASMVKQTKSLERIDGRLNITEVFSALWNDARAEEYLAMLSANHAYNMRFVDYSSPPDRKFVLTDEGDNLLAGVDSELKNRLSLSQKEHPGWTPAQIIRDDDLAVLQALLRSYNEKSGKEPVDFLTLVGVINSFLIGG